MAEEKSRILRVLEALSQCVDPTKPTDIGSMIGETPFNTGHDLFELEKSGMAEKPDKEKSLYLITDRGRETLENPPDKWVYKSRREPPPRTPPPGAPPGAPFVVPSGAPPEEITVPSQADLFWAIGEKLGVGTKKGDIRLDAITYYVQRTADLDNLSSVWNALTEMGVANDVKKRWIKLYAQNLPGKEIPEELREKLDIGEAEKIKTDAGEIPPKPKRFSVVGGEIIGDPEGDLNFKEALQLLAQQRGAPAEAVNPLATMVDAMKMGPEMATATLTAMIPLITKEPPKPSGEGALLDRLDSLGLLRKPGEEGRAPQIDMLDKMNQLGLLKKPGEEGEGSQTIRALETQIKELSESLRKQEMDTFKNAVVALSNQVTELRKEMSNQGKLEGRFALMDKALGTIDNQLTGIRTDAKPLLMGIAGGGGGEPSRKSPEEKAKLAKGLKEAVALEKEARELEDDLLFGGKPQS